MKLGYARISADENNLHVQIDALREAGADRVFEDRGVSGAMVFKPAYGDMLREAKAGDEIIVWRLDRLSRSLPALIRELELIGGLKVGFRSLTEQIETLTPAGRLFFHMVAAFAQFGRDVSYERASAELQTSRRGGKKLGRPPVISEDQWKQVKPLLSEPHNLSVVAVAGLLNVTRQAIYKRLSAEKLAEQETV